MQIHVFFLLFVRSVSSQCLSSEDLHHLNIIPLSRHPIKDRIVLERDWWNGHYLTTEIGRILLTEAMGFPVEIKDFEGSTSFLEMTARSTDINLELWPFSQLQGSIYDANIVNAGPMGIIGRVGLYFPKYLIEDYPYYFELWRSYLKDDTTSVFPRGGTFPDTVDGREFVPPQCLIATEPPDCDVYGEDFDNYLCNVTEIDPNCMTIWSYDFTYDGAWIHQQIRNLGLNWTVSHLYDYDPLVENSSALRNPFIVYSWTPNTMNNIYQLQRINFNELSPACVSNIGLEKDGIGSVDCDFQIQVILKIHSDRLLSTPSLRQAAQFVRAFTLTTEQQEEILYPMGAVDPNPTFGSQKDDPIGRDLACEWVKNNSHIWATWIVNVPPDPLPYVTFWYNAGIIALFFTAFNWVGATLLCVVRQDVHPLNAVPWLDLVLGTVCPLFAMFIPIGVLVSWESVGCYSTVWMLAMVTPISFVAPLFVSYSVVIEVMLQELRSAFIFKRISPAVAAKKLSLLRVLKSVRCQLAFCAIILLFSVFLTLGVSQFTPISDGDHTCTIDSSWRIILLIELIFYVVLIICLAPTVLKASHRRAFFVTIFPISFVGMAVAVSALFQTDVMTVNDNPFSFNAVFSLHWMIAVLVYIVIVEDPALRTLSSLRLHHATKVSETDVELTLTMLLDSAVAFRHFLAFAREQFCEENVLALRAVYRFDQNPTMEEMHKIFEKSLARGSLFAINISAGCFSHCEKAYNAIRNSTETPTTQQLQSVFSDVQTELRRLIDYNLVLQFKNSPHFEHFLAELDDKEEGGTARSFKRLRSRLGAETRRSGQEAGSRGGSKNDADDSVTPTSTLKSDVSESKNFDFLGLPTSFTTARVSKNVQTPPSGTTRIEMAGPPTELL